MFTQSSISHLHQIDDSGCSQLLDSIKREVEKLSLHYDFYQNDSDQALFEYTNEEDRFTEFLMDVARIEDEHNPQKVLNYLTEALCLYEGEHGTCYHQLEHLLHNLDVYCNGQKIADHRKDLLPKFATMVADLIKHSDNVTEDCE